MLAHDYSAAVVRKRHGSIYTTAGDPDLEILFHGIHIECELKQVGQQPTPLQRRRLEQWAAAGAVTAVVHTVEEMREVMQRALWGTRLWEDRGEAPAQGKPGKPR